MKTLTNKIALLLLIACSFANVSNAENMKKLGSMNVHYMAIGATFLSPEIAKAYDIQRSRYNGLINISVLDNTDKNTPAKTVSLMGKARNNLGQTKTLEFKEVKEGSSVYYLAQIKYQNEETFHFDILINDGKEKQQLKFSQKFYVD